MERERIMLKITWEKPFPACASISHYDLTIQLNEQQIFYKRYSVEETREKVLEDLDPYTKYTIILIAVNNAFYQSSAEPRYITTPELAPYDSLSLSIDFDTNCAYLTIQDPTQPNGIITKYQYTCYYANTEGGYQSILATDKQYVSLCEFRSAEKVKCSAKAINSAGESPVTSQTGYTKIAVTQRDKAELKHSKNKGKSFRITVHQVTLDNRKPDSYVFVVQKETSTSKRKKRSSVQLPPECDLDSNCYITAEIDSSLVDSEGYDFRVGDGKTYQDYYNAPLEPNQDYKIYQAVTVQMEDGFVLIEYYEDPITVFLNPICALGCIVAIAVTVFDLLVGVVLLVVLIKRRRRNFTNKTKQASTSANTGNAYQTLELTERSKQANDAVYATIPECSSDTAKNKTSYEEVDMTSIPTNKLQDYIKETISGSQRRY
ncbi:hypothetical protein EB796_016746 [Bugula neritina]|uniref:Fibronectin type-III domain-containing protein n=1 Tax=Bugula neritina TaxID=10212 RepID=A0A7J7JH88_BUGNE|nr:hypothetical protein EB796_016746 [Bugula neritina]